ncbi:hypothetical protein SARC_06811 [Sphaeroforma arctica JP610]|uniref:Uncharacterized protein n=1 Tax=Sphaeroforma arctica JP610 TaxID=667725 RepID=A0A0L0FW03_9EUKA|nr:hypothetical protein SARC_06811 [Sphaeroforma arctica JP610]KNC80829.1 hypothetical protein SARC_06811 [Sphaeroforma arctica JP610]|eukprot:XP_014154731.1 hypothetical protein SARC_06811 [Sphaeroforma arctica JP610]
MANTRQSRRQQQLSPEQRECEEIHQRECTGRPNNLNEEHQTNQSVLQRTLMAQQNRTERIATPSDVDFTEQGLGTPEAMGAARLATHNHLQATATVREGVNNTTDRRHRNRPRGTRQSRDRENDTPEQLTRLLRRQQSLLEKYNRRLQRLRRSTTPQTSDNLEFRIRGADRSRRGLGYTSSDQEGSEAPHNEVSLHDFVQEQHRAQKNPHGREALDNRRDNMETSLHTRRQGCQFKQEALSDMLPAQ